MAGSMASANEERRLPRRGVVGDDPLPYGLARNRKAMEAAIRFACDQKLLLRRVTLGEMFARNTLELE
jgi:4,5-dihydroxyphthalate decarboxylase